MKQTSKNIKTMSRTALIAQLRRERQQHINLMVLVKAYNETIEQANAQMFKDLNNLTHAIQQLKDASPEIAHIQYMAANIARRQR